MSESTDVLVAGGGTVGLAAAAALSQQGFSVTLIERSAPPPHPANGEMDVRVYALSPASIRLLDSLGVWTSITAVRQTPYHAMQVWRDEPAQALRFAARPGEALGSIVEHGLLNASLWNQSGAWQRLSGATIHEVACDDDGALVVLADGRSLSAKLLVVADGPDSPLRQQLGLESVGWGYEQQALVAHITTESPHGGVARQRFLPTGPLALLPLADGRSSIVWSVNRALATELLTLDDAGFALRLATASQGVLGSITALTPRRSFPLRLQHLPQTVTAGAVVIGDAAHVIHPLAGQGVNLGLADAQVLAETLTEARRAGRGWWRPRTLQAYARSRRPQTIEMLAMTDALARGFTGPEVLARGLGAGLELLDRAGPIKQWLAGQASR